MTMTQLADVQNQVQKVWANLLIDELLEASLLAKIVNKEYEGEINNQNDTVYVSEITRPTATRRTTGANEDSFEATKLATNRVALVANQIITAAFEFNDLVQIQSQIGAADSIIRQALSDACAIAVNNYLYSIVAPSGSAPDLTLSGVSTFDATALLNVRKAAAQQKWPDSQPKYLLVDPSYQNDLFAAQTLTSADYVLDYPNMEGKYLRQRFGFNILEDNSAGMSAISPTTQTAQLSLALTPNAILSAIGAPKFEISSLHSQKRHGYLISATVIMGACLGLQGSLKMVTTFNT